MIRRRIVRMVLTLALAGLFPAAASAESTISCPPGTIDMLDWMTLDSDLRFTHYMTGTHSMYTAVWPDKVWYTKDGKTWTDVTKNLDMKPWGTITSIQPSFFESAAAYISVDYHLMDDREPYIYKTADFGQTWTKITSGLPMIFSRGTNPQ